MPDPETRLSLLVQLADPDAEAAWAEFVRLYRPLIYRVARKSGLQHADADDLSQDVLAKVGKAIDSFEPRSSGSFRGWLYRMTRNQCVNQLTRGKSGCGSGDSDIQRMLHQHPQSNETITLFEIERRRMRFRRIAEDLRPQFSLATWQAFWLTAVDGKTIQEAAIELGKTELAIRLARCRVLKQFREQVQREDSDDSP